MARGKKTGRTDNEPARQRLGALLRQGRKREQLTQETVAARARISASTISRLERGDAVMVRTVTASTFGWVRTVITPSLEPDEIERLDEAARQLGIPLEAARDEPPSKSAASREPLVPRFGLGIEAGWEELVARGHALNQANQWDEALPYLQGAQAEARTGEQRAEALLEEAAARWHLADERYAPALYLSLDALTDLGLEHLEPESGVVPEEFASASSEHAIRLCCWAARQVGEVYLRWLKFRAGAGCFRFVERLGLLLADRELQAEGLHWQMRTLVERGTTPARDGEWRVVRDRAALDRALVCFDELTRRQVWPADDDNMGQHLRWKARILELLGDASDANKERARAEAYFSEEPNTIHLHHLWFDLGVAAVVADDARAAGRYLNQALDHSARIKYPKTVADALACLSYVGGVSLSSAEHERALSCAIAALLAFPTYLDTEEGKLILGWCADLADDLAGQPGGRTRRVAFWTQRKEELVEDIRVARSPFYLLRGLRTADEATVKSVLEALDERMAAPDPS